ncbi:uncharacterized protein F4822DRAFT_434977 [Hypoxylon trugodes]|uniref:uncharacterized protein n=1 Tax=Hypoxylon trugodes TaxID=326681 RepID=UPI0021973FEE|nr:uncharacterized protein F4822DRAFT_434977 [Hypoxylon trugodes]KAI1383051.1 hypothetical protein F4822DRAFT_434977 [Hypoxylon trugodes]
MRPDVSALGILACLTGLATAQDTRSDGENVTTTGGTATVQFIPNAVIEVQSLPTYPIYIQGRTDEVIAYRNAPGVVELNINAVLLHRFTDNATIGQGAMIDFSTSPVDLDSDSSKVRRQETEPFPFTMTNETVTLPVQHASVYGSNINKLLYFEFQWQNSTGRGSSYSQLVSVVSSDAEIDKTNELFRDSQKETNAVFPDVVQLDSTTNPTTSASPAAETLTQASTSNIGTKLSGGAIAGIAVGCAVAGVLIIGLIAWCLFFRRRAKRDRNVGTNYATNSGSGAIIADKELTGMTDTSPSAAYPDDGGHLHDPRGSMVRGDDGPYGPYSDRGASPLPPPGTAFAMGSQTDLASGRPSTTRAPSPPHQSRYAHLIEEGMTEDEIRRLEEEERHLDAAIEGRGHRNRAGSESIHVASPSLASPS